MIALRITAQHRARQALRLGALLMLLPALSACLSSVLPPADSRRVYRLPAAEVPTAAQRLPGSLLVDAILAPLHFDRDALVATTARGEVQWIEGARWSARLPELLREHSADALERAGSADSVVQRSAQAELRWRLSGELREYGVAPDGRVHLRISWRLICVPQARSVAQRAFELTATPSAADAASHVAAFADVAAQHAQAQVRWLGELPADTCAPAGASE